MIGREIVVFVRVGGEVIECGLSALDDEFPVATPNTYHVGLVELPIEVVVLPLCLRITEEGRQNADSVGIRQWDDFTIGQLRHFTIGQLRDITEGGEEVIEGEGLVAHAAGSDISWPADDERDTDAALVCAALEAAELAVVVEVVGVCSALFVRSVVTGED